jgi:hypothetical protein
MDILAWTDCIGDTLGYNKGTVSRVADNVTNALIARKDQFIKWPTDNHRQNKSRYGFFQQANFPNEPDYVFFFHLFF